MPYPLIEGQMYTIHIEEDFGPESPLGIHEVILKCYKYFNDAPLGIDCYSTNDISFCPEWIIGMGPFSLENE